MDKENVTYTHNGVLVINNEIMSFAGKWMELKIILSEVNQAQKAKYCMFLLTCEI
jgi:hypothetical protein